MLVCGAPDDLIVWHLFFVRHPHANGTRAVLCIFLLSGSTFQAVLHLVFDFFGRRYLGPLCWAQLSMAPSSSSGSFWASWCISLTALILMPVFVLVSLRFLVSWRLHTDNASNASTVMYNLYACLLTVVVETGIMPVSAVDLLRSRLAAALVGTASVLSSLITKEYRAGACNSTQVRPSRH